jgi:hypothetical protein
VIFAGVSLEQLAGVQAACADGIVLDAVLAQEAIAAEAWHEAERAWRVALAGSAELQLALVQKRRIAEDALARAIDPLDDDPAAWVGLLGALALAPDSAAVLEPLGLSAGDVSRLGRAWGRKAAADPALGKRLGELAATAQAPATVRAEPLVLRRFPWSPEAATPPPTDPLTAAVGGRLPVETDADLFAALEVVLELLPARRSEWLALCGVAVERYEAIAGAWRDRAESSPDVRADLTVRIGDHRAALRAIVAGRTPILERRPNPR